MKMQGVCTVLLACLFASCVGARLLTSGSSAPSSGDKKTPDFDYFLFVQQSPGSFCAARGSCPLVHLHGFKFTIHGLWPDNRDGTWPQFCDDTAYFHEDVLRDILPEMREVWPSYFDSNDQFWQHEWSKHGTCALSLIDSEKNFFSTVLDLHREYDLGAALAAKDIVPSSTARYSVAEVRDAITDMYDVGALVHCDAHGQLSEVWICLTKDLKPMDCPPAAAPTCKDVKIPPMPSALEDKSTQTEEDEEEEEEDKSIHIEGDEEEEEEEDKSMEAEEDEEEEGGWLLVQQQSEEKEGADAATQTGGAKGQQQVEEDEEDDKEDEEDDLLEQEEEEQEEEDEEEEARGAPRAHAGQGGSGAALSQLHWAFPVALLLAGLACVALLAGVMARRGREAEQAALGGRRPRAEEETKPLLP